MSEDFSLKRPQTILSLCDGSGAWSRPYVDADYDVVRVDLAFVEGCGENARRLYEDVRLLRHPDRPIHGILAAPPCTVFAASGNRWHREEDEMLDGLSIVDACLRIIYVSKPTWWALENPVGKLVHYLGPPKLTFQPNEYGDNYTKRTCLWGEFKVPLRELVPATAGSRLHRLPPSRDRAALRSVTPSGFAHAFFEANP